LTCGKHVIIFFACRKWSKSETSRMRFIAA
jgi:hypothetical protein